MVPTVEYVYNAFVGHENENISETLKNSILEAMIVFAGNHSQEALRQASEVAEDYGKETIAEKILESYSLENIK